MVPSSRVKASRGVRPLFLVGCPRVGLSLLAELLAPHEELGWVSTYGNRRRAWGPLGLAQRVYDAPAAGLRLYREAVLHRQGRVGRWLPYPTEPWRFWENRLPAFTRWLPSHGWDPRDPSLADLSPDDVRAARAAVAAHLRWAGRPRLLSYYGGAPRIDLMLEVFPDARFVHLTRDGRAVVESLVRMIEQGLSAMWRDREALAAAWPERYRRAFAEDPSPLAVCALEWMHLTGRIRAAATTFAPSRVLEVHYTALADAPAATLDRILAFAELPPSPRIAHFLELAPPTNNDGKWAHVWGAEERRRFARLVEPPFDALTDSRVA